jgi:hypothetical protein
MSPSPGGAAIANPPREDIFYLAEHLPEAAEETRYATLPWPDSAGGLGGWRPLAGLAGADIAADFATARGGILTLGASHPWGENGAFDLFAFYGSFSVGGDPGENVLREFALAGVPLDLPETALFSDPRGTFIHSGIGFAYAYRRPAAPRWRYLAGALVERLELQDYRFDYELTGGEDAGASGVLDLSGTNEFVTPYFGVEWSQPLGASWSLLPRAQIGVPLPPGDFEARLTGPGFDLSTATTGAESGKIGDGFFTVGASFVHLPSGLEIDLGTTAAFPLVQRLSHPGVDRAWVLAVGWHDR